MCADSSRNGRNTRILSNSGAIVGVSDHGGWAVLVTVARDGTVLDRRRVKLVDDGLPKSPISSRAQRLPVDTAVALVNWVRLSVERHAKLELDALAKSVPDRISGIALRRRQPLPPTVAGRIANYRATIVADCVMYRQALADAAEARGWDVHWFERKNVFGAASAALGIDDFDAHIVQLRKSVGPPWDMDHRLALAAGISAGETRT